VIFIYVYYIMSSFESTIKHQGGKTKKARKSNSWAKAAGEYYRAHKNEVNSFSDVLKSADFRAFYNKKYKGNKRGGDDKGDDKGNDKVEGGDNDGPILDGVAEYPIVNELSLDETPIPAIEGGKKKKSRKSSKKSRKSKKKRFFGII